MTQVEERNVGSKLCEKCSVLQFDDSKIGGYEAENETGESVLNFGEHIYNSNELKLDYMQSDVLPELQVLKAASDAGCVFCGGLRNATLRTYSQISGKVTFRLRLLVSHGFLAKGLCALFVDLTVETTETLSNPYLESLLFYIDCPQGTITRHFSFR